MSLIIKEKRERNQFFQSYYRMNRRLSKKTIRKSKQGSRKHKGGNSDLRFRYTKSPERIEWTDGVYEHGAALATILPKIDWQSYQYEGPTELVSERIIQQKVTLKRTTPYAVFGGAACELLNTKYRGAADLHYTTDPTGDIDVKINGFDFSVEDEELSGPVLMVKENRYTQLGDHFSTWLFNQVTEKLQDLTAEFSSDKFILPEKANTDESSTADKEQSVGKFLVSRYVQTGPDASLGKIQITMKIKSETGPIADHLMEFVYFLKQELISPPVKTILYNTIAIQDPATILFSQLTALESRALGYNSDYSEKNKQSAHKVLNHCGRILFLAKLLSYGKTKKITEITNGLPDAQIARIYFTIKGISEKQASCNSRNNACNIKNKNICKSLADNFLKAVFFYELPGKLDGFLTRLPSLKPRSSTFLSTIKSPF